ncbi:hypothetical protein HGRIS_013160 [Hohenbuehelia grisea]|uniref:Pali-domain-containing protein n=1 Tax=Hohenbuehelia grisea TaxID=104357 RepID=A0ABR3IUM2_9AGAR
MLAIIAPALIFVGFVLLLLASLSAPVIPHIALFKIAVNLDDRLFNGLGPEVDFGAWGYCLRSLDFPAGGFGAGFGGGFGGFGGVGGLAGFYFRDGWLCRHPRIGYYFDDFVAATLRVSPFFFRDTISQRTSSALTLHIVACVFAFIALIISLSMLKPGTASRIASLCTMAVAVFAALFTSIVFLVDVIFVSIVRDRVESISQQTLKVRFGPMPWLVLGAAIALWLSLLGACAGMLTCGSRRFRKAKSHESS